MQALEKQIAKVHGDFGTLMLEVKKLMEDNQQLRLENEKMRKVLKQEQE